MIWQAFSAILRRDLLLAWRRKSEGLSAVFFCVVVAALFPLGIGPELNVLRNIAPGVLWVGALLSSMLALQACLKQITAMALWNKWLYHQLQCPY